MKSAAGNRWRFCFCGGRVSRDAGGRTFKQITFIASYVTNSRTSPCRSGRNLANKARKAPAKKETHMTIRVLTMPSVWGMTTQ